MTMDHNKPLSFPTGPWKTMLAAALLGAFTLAAAPAQAGEAEVIMKLLLKKGIISQSEYDQVMREFNDLSPLESQVRENQEKIAELRQKQEERIVHVDKHLSHMEENTTRVLEGLSVAGDLTMVVQGSSGNDTNNPAEGDTTDGSYSIDLELSSSLGDHGEGFILVEAGEGAGLEGDEITSYWGVNGDAGDSGARLEVTEAWYEHRFSEDLVATAGKLNLTNYFDGNEVANDETIQFLAGGFVNSIAVEFPDNSAAARLSARVNDLVSASIAWQSGDGDWEGIFDNAFYMAELDLTPSPAGRDGNYRLYGWTNQTDHAKLTNAADTDNPGWGLGISLDQQLGEACTLFARIGYQDDSVYEVAYAISGGLAVSGSKWSRPDDVFSIAYGMALLSSDQETVLRAAGTNPADESHFEAYYSYQVNEYLTITPDLQAVVNANGNDASDTVWLGAVRGQVNF